MKSSYVKTYLNHLLKYCLVSIKLHPAVSPILVMAKIALLAVELETKIKIFNNYVNFDH